MKKITFYLALALAINSHVTIEAQDEQDNSPTATVSKALASLIGLTEPSMSKELQFEKMKQFNTCFLNPKAKQKVFLPLVLGKLQGFKIVKESMTDEGATVEAQVQLKQAMQNVIFELIFRKEQWFIAEVR